MTEKLVAHVEDTPDRAAQARRLRARGALYARHLVGDWFETSAPSDGMSGHVDFENVRTTAHVSFHWSVTSPHAQSEQEAREAALADLGRD